MDRRSAPKGRPTRNHAERQTTKLSVNGIGVFPTEIVAAAIHAAGQIHAARITKNFTLNSGNVGKDVAEIVLDILDELIDPDKQS